MSFPKPEHTKSAVDKAGDILINPKSKLNEIQAALNILSNWRACHGYPLNTFQSTLRNRLKKYKISAIVAQRLKRLSTIAYKLRRFKGMRLSRMQDIGGLRAIVFKLTDVDELKTIYLSDKEFRHELVRTDDYIEKPKKDGYRSFHLAYKYKNPKKPQYNGLLIELQIRTKLQHIWATAVETMGTYLGQGLKSGEGEKKWRDFFALTSSAFAFIENTPPVPGYSHMTEQETINALTHLEQDIQAVNTMQGYGVALNIINEKKTSSYYHLIILNYGERKVEIKSYSRENIKQAARAYNEAEARASEGEKIDAVLVSAGDINQLKRAYPNFFLDVQEFTTQVQNIISNKK